MILLKIEPLFLSLVLQGLAEESQMCSLNLEYLPIYSQLMGNK